MSTKVQKWGNSLGVRIPKGILDATHMKEGTPIEFRIEGSHVVLLPVKRKEITLAELLKNLGPSDFNEREFWGKPRGKEVW